MTQRILFVDDDPHLLSAFQRNLRKDFAFDLASGPREALEFLRSQGPYAVIVADMRMPGMDGVTLLQHLSRLAPDTVRVMLTGNAERQTTMDAINRGQVFRFLTKPCPPDVLVPTLHAALRQHQLICAERDLLEGTLKNSVHALLEVLGLTVPEAYSRGHQLREAMRRFATFAGFTPLWELEIAAELSQLGYASVPHEIVRKQRGRIPLSTEEQAVVERVPRVGHDLLHRIPRLENIARIVLMQHKNYDGSGFPHDHCVGADIPLGARILRILEDRMLLELEEVAGAAARQEMVQRTGRYDPELLEKSFECFPTVVVPVSGGERPPLALRLGELRPGQHLHADIRTPAGLVLATRGQDLTALMIERLRNLLEIGEVREPFLIEDEPGALAAEPEDAATSAGA